MGADALAAVGHRAAGAPPGPVRGRPGGRRRRCAVPGRPSRVERPRLLATVAFFALRLGLSAVEPDSEPARPLLAMAAGLVAGAGLAAVLLAPFGDCCHSSDLDERSGTGVDHHLDASQLIGFFLFDYWGRATDTALVPFLFARSWYVGALPLMLAAAALVLRPGPSGSGSRPAAAAARRDLRCPAIRAGGHAPPPAEPRPQRSADRRDPGVPGAARRLGLDDLCTRAALRCRRARAVLVAGRRSCSVP